MRLVRIEAGRFGKIDGRTLGDLSPGLTVVHGPNESGKSSLMALVRHVLYGFPTKGDAKEAPYLSGAGAREGRLVFADDDGEWVVERKEGAHGGPVNVRTLSGRPHGGLVGELTAGVSRLAYRVVFGFGLAEMQQIEELKGKDDDLIAHLYAAGAGLTVSPIDVRAKLEASRDALWAKRASTPMLNRAKARRDELRSEIRALESEADRLRADASRLEGLEREVEAARHRRIETRMSADRASRAVAEASRLLDSSASLGRDAEALEREAAAARETADARAVDEAALAAAELVDALAAELSGFRERLASLASTEARLAEVEARLRTTLDDAGWSEERALAAAADAGVAAELDAQREAIAKARGRMEAASEARDRLRAPVAPTPGAPAQRGRPWVVPGAVVAVLGAVGVGAGLAFSQPFLTVLAAAALAIGAALLAAGAALALFRAEPGGGAAAIPSRQQVAAAEAEYAAANTVLAGRMGSWMDWIRSRGLGTGVEDPAAIAARYQCARAARAAAAERATLRESGGRERERTDAYAARVRSAAAAVFGAASAADGLEGVPELVDRMAAKVADTRAAASARSEALARADRSAHEATIARESATSAAQASAAALEAVGAISGGIEAARALESETQSLATDASDEFDRVSEETIALRTALGTERRESALSEARLEEETLGEQIADGIRRYAVLAVASELLSMAQERYERDRQPEVVKRAEVAFASMTNGRYARVTVPLGKDAIEVFDAASEATSPGRLSRGTAEQLYLALRLGLIEQLGDAGKGLPVLMDDILVDFSPDRLEPAARAIADLASRRQVVFLTCHPATADLLCRLDP